jgi:hypothetical protein
VQYSQYSTKCKGVISERNVPMDAVSVTHAFEIVESHFDQIIPTSIKIHVSKCYGVYVYVCVYNCVCMFMVMKNRQTISIT